MRYAIYTLAILLAIASVGCSSSSGGGGSSATGTTTTTGGVPPVTTPVNGVPGTTGGATTTLVLTNKVALDTYVGWSTNSPTNIQVNVSLQKYGTYAKSGGGTDTGFGGYVTVSFTDSSHNYSDTFSSLWRGGINTVSGNTQNHIYNLLSSDYPGLNGSIGYHGFFEDNNEVHDYAPIYGAPIFGGALILVIDNFNSTGDGTPPTTANGSVWFVNYIAQYPMGPIPDTSCWFRETGPYDCRAWKTSNNVATKSAIYPDAGYQLLGNFYNLDVKAAFNNQI